MRTRGPGLRGAAVIAAVALGVGLASACRQAGSPRPARRVVRFTTGTPGAGFYPLGRALARAYAAAFPDLDVEVRESAGSVSNVEALERGTADIGLAYADVAYMAYAGRLGEGVPPYSNLRGMAVLELAPVHVIVGPGSDVRDVAGLRGRRIAVGPTGSGSALTAQMIVRVLGVGTGGTRLESLPYNEAATRLAAGTLDALFVTGSDPVESVRAVTRAGGRLLPLTGPAIDRLRRDYPFFRQTAILGGTYPSNPDAVTTIGVDNLLVCRRGLDESLVHDLTRQFFASLPSLSMLSFMDLDQAPATPIPLHDGAARYYRERELTR